MGMQTNHADKLSAQKGSGFDASSRPRTAPEALNPRLPGVSPLGNDVILVCELVSDDEFLVRAEKEAGAAPASASQAKSFQTSCAALPPPVYAGICALPGATKTSEKGCWAFPMSRLEATSTALLQFGKVERVPDWVRKLVHETKESTAASLDDELLPQGLLPYQSEGVNFGLRHGGRLLIGDEMGLGKTLQSLALSSQFTDDWPVLVVCPSMLRFVWKEQMAQWMEHICKIDEVQIVKKGTDTLRPDAAFWVLSYELLARDAKGTQKFQQRPDGSPHQFVIADESHNIKDWKAERTKALVPLLRKAKRSILLSGTPTRNSAEELHPQLCGLVPNMAASFCEFRARYCKLQQRNVFGGRQVNQVVGGRNGRELNYLLTNSVMIRRQKKDVLKQLPEKRRQKVPLDVVDTKQLKDIRKDMVHLNSIMEGSTEEKLGMPEIFGSLAQAKLPAVKEYLQDVMDRGDEKAIVFAHHHHMIDELDEVFKSRLAKDGQTHIRIDGRTSMSTRSDLVKKFQTDPDCRVALLSITACGEGLTLTAAGLVIFAELYWVPGVLEQAEARAHRIGTTHSKVIVEFLVVPNSPDERIYDMLERKKKVTSTVLDGAAVTLGATTTARRKPAPRKAESPHPEDLVKKKSKTGLSDMLVSEKDRQRSSQDISSPESKKSRSVPDADTPPPVCRKKVEFLLRAAGALK